MVSMKRTVGENIESQHVAREATEVGKNLLATPQSCLLRKVWFGAGSVVGPQTPQRGADIPKTLTHCHSHNSHVGMVRHASRAALINFSCFLSTAGVADLGRQ
jgi:hypothetical protein